MNKKCFIDYETYKDLLSGMNSSTLFDGSLGKNPDMEFIKEDQWLCDAAVIERIVRIKGLWFITLVFASHFQPYQFLIRKIKGFSDKKKSILHASIFRRQAAKDQRGTIRVDIERYGLNNN